MTPTTDHTMLRVEQLQAAYPLRRNLMGRATGWAPVVGGVDLTIPRGQTLGLVGESGSGKTTLARALLRLAPRSRINGRVTFDGQDVFAARGRRLKALRRRMQIVFQDPATSLDPRMTVGRLIAEPLAAFGLGSRRSRRRDVEQMLDRVGLPTESAARYPHELSGGQRQRVAIARALAAEPDLLVCDEPTSSLDVSVQAQILNLLRDLQHQLGLSCLFISHDLAVVEHVADTIAVMYLGRVIEVGPTDTLVSGGQARHPYTQRLLDATGATAPSSQPEPFGETPSAASPPTGCPFHRRCPLTRHQAKDLPGDAQHVVVKGGAPIRMVRECVSQRPPLRQMADDPRHYCACLLG